MSSRPLSQLAVLGGGVMFTFEVANAASTSNIHTLDSPFITILFAAIVAVLATFSFLTAKGAA